MVFNCSSPYILYAGGSNAWLFVAICVQGAVTKSSLDNTTTSKMAGLVKGITNQARSVVRDLDPVNELAFLRLRSTKTEFLIAPGGT